MSVGAGARVEFETADAVWAAGGADTRLTSSTGESKSSFFTFLSNRPMTPPTASGDTAHACRGYHFLRHNGAHSTMKRTAMAFLLVGCATVGGGDRRVDSIFS